MEWKEAGKWILVIAAGGVIATILEMVITNKIAVEAKAAAHTEVERVITAAVQQLQAQQQQPIKPPQYVQPQKQEGYIYQI
jgi:hypothetical protein